MSGQDDERRLRFHLFMCGNDGYLPHMHEGVRETNYVDLPSGEFSLPLLAQDEMRRYISNLVSAELLGFDSTVVMEQRVPAIYPSSTVLAGWLLAKTTRLHVGALGPTTSTYLNPLKIAEEIAMLDVMSGGRAFVAIPMGTGNVYHQMGTNPTTVRRRHQEAVELITRALTEPGPFEHRGEFFNLPYVNLWPRPLRQPPEIWMPASGSRESQVLAARGRYTYVSYLSGIKGMKRYVDALRSIAQDEFGYDPPPRQIAACVHVYVAESDQQARKEFEAHILWFYQSVLRGAFEDSFPPGSVTIPSMRGLLDSGFHFKPEDMTFDELTRDAVAIVGSPETVTAQLERLVNEVGVGQVIVMADGGSAPEWMVRKSMELFAREVMPKFRPPGGRPFWAEERPVGYETLSEAGALMPKPPREALVDLKTGEGMFRVYDAHVDDLRVPVDTEPRPER
ncbi:LLM class flavin-dependent oxidoreductase [Streptomyces sp. NPDC057474]|uniref:LLM class flavin-dependent oxidoreductase n=1 Tax=Streptomyces sp. NPDC057474 TaxID=3346144 RepID=UPI0036C4AAFE